MRRARPLIAGVMLVGAVSCTDRLVRGARYELASANGGPLPIVLRYDGGCTHRLYGGVVQFDGSNGFKASYDVRKFCRDSVSRVPEVEAVGRFEKRNDTTFFQDSVGRDTGHGSITADSLIVQGATHRLVFLRRDR